MLCFTYDMSLVDLTCPFLMGLFGSCELWAWGSVSRSEPSGTSLKGNICLCSWAQPSSYHCALTHFNCLPSPMCQNILLLP